MEVRDENGREEKSRMFPSDYEKHGFEIVHVGLNTGDGTEAQAVAALLKNLFGFRFTEGRDSIFSGERLELMKTPSPGTHGHIAVAVNDIHRAIAFLEASGFELDHHAVKYNAEGELILIYLKQEIAGFAFHLLQKQKASSK